MTETINKMMRTSNALVREIGREPTPEEIAERMDISPEKVRKALKVAKEPISLDAPMGEDENSYLADFLEDPKAVSPVEAAEHRAQPGATAFRGTVRRKIKAFPKSLIIH
jgi:RNA polymerase primary sigma factor